MVVNEITVLERGEEAGDAKEMEGRGKRDATEWVQLWFGFSFLPTRIVGTNANLSCECHVFGRHMSINKSATSDWRRAPPVGGTKFFP